MREDGIVPFSMKHVWLKDQRGHILIGDLATGRIGIGIELALHRESCFSRRRGDQFEDHCIADERLAPPVLAGPAQTNDAQSCSICWCLEESGRC
jgi:hypothetical protein